MGPRIVAGERPLLAFVSSVMRPEIQWARDTTVEALTKNPTLIPWAFEFTPLSSETADASYLSKVREADFVVWLVDETTTLPVRNEIGEALAADRRLWVIMLPADDRDEQTTQLLQDVRQRAKTGEASNENELRELLALTFSDEVVRAIRDTPSLTRLALLEQLGRRSRARMVNRWVAVGLGAAESISFADDLSVGAPPPNVLPNESRPLLILVGDVGVGKSVVAERAMQIALVEARSRVGAPTPVFLHMRDATSGLEPAIRTGADGLGDPRLQGAYVVVDGADEVTPDVAVRVIEEARELAHALPQMRILITSRPTAALRRGVPERVELPPLTAEEARALVGRVGGYEITVGAESGWPQSVRDAVRRPLFAILMGLNHRAGRSAPPQTTGQLLGELVEGAVDPATAEDALPSLRRLACLVTDGGAPIDRAELGDAAARAALRASRIASEEEGQLDFALPILTQWFAADALVAGDLAVVDLVSRPRLDRWRYPLAIALATGSRQFVDEAMATLVAGEPAFAAEIVNESFQRWTTPDDLGRTRKSAAEVGGALLTAITTWADAIQPLDRLLLPHDTSGKLAPLGVSVHGHYLTLGWYRGAGEMADVSELPADANIFDPPAEWVVQRSGVWSNERGWAWQWALELLRHDLKRKLESRSLRTADAALIDEAVWLLALDVIRSGSLRHEPVAIEALEDALGGIPPAGLIQLSDRITYADQVLARLRELRASGATEISPPWPAPDQPRQAGGWIWDVYSPGQQQRRVEAVYGAALVAYETVVTEWFPRLKGRMRIATKLPATLRGSFRPSTSPPEGVKPFEHMSEPTLSWYFDPLPPGAESGVNVTFAEEESQASARGSEDWRAEAQLRVEKLTSMRPDAAGWISDAQTYGVVGAAFQGAPLAPLVYGWLRDDLAAIKWQ